MPATLGRAVSVLTSTAAVSVKISMVLASDALAIRAAIQTTGVTDPAALRLARIRDTPSLGELQANPAAVAGLNGAAQVEVEGPPEPLAFDDAGDLPGLSRT